MSATGGKDEGGDEGGLVDVTALFRRAASSLTMRDPLLRAGAPLGEYMSALEVTDPIMDCCELPLAAGRGGEGEGGGEGREEEGGGGQRGYRRRTVPPRRFPAGLDDPLTRLPWAGLTLPGARLLAAHALTRLYAVLAGSGAAEATYSYLYAYDPVLADMASRLEERGGAAEPTVAAQRAVLASALLLVKLTQLVRSLAQHADIYEEEDFNISANGFRFAPPVDGDGLEKAVGKAVEALEGVLRSSEATPATREAAEAVLLTLRFQMLIYQAVSSLMALTAENVRSRAAEVKRDLIPRCLRDAEELRGYLNTEGEGGEAIDDGGAIDNGDADGPQRRQLLDAAFDPYLCRRLAGNTPVRKAKFKTPAAALDGLIGIVVELDWTVCDLLLEGGSSLARARRTLGRVSKSSVNILSRSLIVIALYFDDLLLGQYHLGDFIADDMRSVGSVPEALVSSQHCQNLLIRLGKPIYDTLKVLALNRNRQHAYIDTLMITDWPQLQKEAAAIDFEFRLELAPDASEAASLLTNYVTATTVGIMGHHVGLSIELGLVRHHHDLAVAFWYWSFLLSTELNIRTAMRKARVHQKMMDARLAREAEVNKAALEQHQHKERQKGGKKKGKKGGAAKAKAAPAENTAASSPALVETEADAANNIEFLVLGLKRTLCRGMVRYIAALDQSDLLQRPVYEFTSLKKRFEKRFESLFVIETPPALTYDDFQQGYSFESVTPPEVISSASECFKAGKAVTDSLLSQVLDEKDHSLDLPISRSELMNLAKVCVGNSVYLHKLLQQVKGGGKATGKAVIGFDVHNTFATIKII